MTGTNYFPGRECLKEATNSDVKESSPTLFINIPSWNFVELLLPTPSGRLSFYAKCYYGGTNKPDKLGGIPQLDREEAEEPLIFVLTSDSAIAGTPTIISREGGDQRERKEC